MMMRLLTPRTTNRFTVLVYVVCCTPGEYYTSGDKKCFRDQNAIGGGVVCTVNHGSPPRVYYTQVRITNAAAAFVLIACGIA